MWVSVAKHKIAINYATVGNFVSPKGRICHLLELMLQRRIFLDALENPKFAKDIVKRFFGDHALDYVCPVQAVDAICPENPVLHREQRSIFREEKISYLFEVAVDALHQNIEPVPAHFAALGVEIESFVSHVFVVYPVDRATEHFLHDALGSGVIDLEKTKGFQRCSSGGSWFNDDIPSLLN